VSINDEWIIASLFLGAAAASSGGREADCGLEGIVDPPLEASEGTDHDNSGHEASPKSLEADLRVDLSDLVAERALGLALGDELGEDGVGGVGDDGAEDACEVAGGEGDAELRGLAVVLFSLGEDVVVEKLHEPLEGHELDDRVGHLSSPERTNARVESLGACVN